MGDCGRTTVSAFVDEPFKQMLRREADRAGTTVEDLVACWLWRQFHDSLRRRRVDAAVTVEVPVWLYRHAEDMAAMADDPEARFDEVLFNHVRLDVDWQPVDGQ